MKDISKPTLFDFVLIIIFLSISLLFAYFLYSNNFVLKNGFVEIYQNNQLVIKLSLDENKLIEFKDFVVEIKDKKVRMKNSNCPYKICVHTGWILKPYQQIVCVPNKVVIKIISERNKKNFVDSITY